jgi:hypothetical protein
VSSELQVLWAQPWQQLRLSAMQCRLEQGLCKGFSDDFAVELQAAACRLVEVCQVDS